MAINVMISAFGLSDLQCELPPDFVSLQVLLDQQCMCVNYNKGFEAQIHSLTKLVRLTLDSLAHPVGLAERTGLEGEGYCTAAWEHDTGSARI